MNRTVVYICLLSTGLLFASLQGKAQSANLMPINRVQQPAPAPVRIDTLILPGQTNKLMGKKALPLPYYQEQDEHWSTVIYRMVNLKEGMNRGLYLPETPTRNRKNLITLLLEGIDSGKFKAYNPDLGEGSEFAEVLTPEALNTRLGAATKVIDVADEQGNIVQQTEKRDRQLSEITYLMVMEYWWFDRRVSELKVKVVGLCPIREYQREGVITDTYSLMEEELSESDMLKQQAFWVYYPHIRESLAQYPVYSGGNNAQQLSFDDLFLQHRFTGYIYSELNRLQAANGTQILNETDRQRISEQVENAIFNMEQDMWEY